MAVREEGAVHQGYHDQGGNRERKNLGKLGPMGKGSGIDQCYGRVHEEEFSVCPGRVELIKYSSLYGRALGISLRGKESEDSTVNGLYHSWVWLWLLPSGCQWPLVGFAQLFVIPALPLTAGVTAEAAALLSCEVSAAFTWTRERVSISFVRVRVTAAPEERRCPCYPSGLCPVGRWGPWVVLRGRVQC